MTMYHVSFYIKGAIDSSVQACMHAGQRCMCCCKMEKHWIGCLQNCLQMPAAGLQEQTCRMWISEGGGLPGPARAKEGCRMRCEPRGLLARDSSSTCAAMPASASTRRYPAHPHAMAATPFCKASPNLHRVTRSRQALLSARQADCSLCKTSAILLLLSQSLLSWRRQGWMV